ncbi:MAG TPA: RNA polymerase sporulation sigma factor SigH [Acidimicrobiales bacterium]|jgi:RNA polymerase sporulation-specific sigma factor|nr:RNA polymerase sporulation sigma factor SigH [Acidimicrobiales bacterium]
MSQTSTASSDLADEVLVGLFHEGDAEAFDLLMERYRRFARAKARGYFLAGGDNEDIEQEGLIGLFKAIRDFRQGQSSFRAFAELCITRQIHTAIKTACRQKHQPLNRYVSLWGLRLIDDPSERLVEELFDQRAPDPADEVVSLEGHADMRASLVAMLSELEVEVLCLHLDGCSYSEIGARLGRHVKAVDNALQRIKRKLEAHLAASSAARRSPAA